MATPASELKTIVGTESDVRAALHAAELRGMIRGNTFAVARLKDGRVAVKVHMAAPEPSRPVLRWWSTRRALLAAGVVAGVAIMAAVTWLVIHTVLAVGHVIAKNAGPIVGVLILIAVIVFFGGGGGGRTFSGTFKGTIR